MSVERVEKPPSMRPFFILWGGQAVSLLGSQLVQFALIWWLTQETGSATVLATASIVGLVPQVVLGPFVGVLIDRWNRRLTMLAADAAVALATVVLAYLFWTGNIQIWHVYVILFIRALGGTFHWPAMTASTSLMVPQDQLTRIQGLNQMLNGGLNIASAPLGALLVTLLPMQGVLAVDIVTALIAITALLIIQVPQPPEQEASVAGQSPVRAYLGDLRQGLSYVFSWRGLLIIGVMSMLVNFVLSPTMSFMPLLVTEHFNGTAWHLGILEAGFGLGILAGGLLLGIWGGFKRRVMTSLFGLAGIGIGILLVGLTPAAFYPLAVAGMLIGGIMSSLTNGPIMAIFQSTVAPSMQGRVFTLMGSASAAMMPLGLAIAGPLAEVVGVRTWFIAGGLVTLAAALVGRLIPSLIHLEEERDDFLEEPAVHTLVPVPLTGLEPGETA